MSYVSSASPIPQNSLMPPPQCCVDQSDRRIAQDLAMTTAGRQRVYDLTPDAASLWNVSPQLAKNADTLLQQSSLARQSILPGGVWRAKPKQTGGAVQAEATRSAPENVPMNASRSQADGCAFTGPAVRVAPPQAASPVMPKAAPVVERTPAGPAMMPVPNAPKWANLCWAIRNGAIDSGQFDPSELMKLQYRCSQLGYTGACIPPPNTQAYLEAGRRGRLTLPHVAVTQADLDALPQAPDQIGNCVDSYRLAGLTGYAPVWGDAGLYPRKTRGATGAMSSTGAKWLLAGIALLALAGGGKGR